VQGRQVLEHQLVLGDLGGLVVDLVELGQGEVALPILGRADFTLDGIAGAQIETADLGGRNIDVVGAGQVGRFGGAQEAKAVGKDFQRAITKDGFTFLP